MCLSALVHHAQPLNRNGTTDGSLTRWTQRSGGFWRRLELLIPLSVTSSYILCIQCLRAMQWTTEIASITTSPHSWHAGTIFCCFLGSLLKKQNSNRNTEHHYITESTKWSINIEFIIMVSDHLQYLKWENNLNAVFSQKNLHESRNDDRLI